MRNVIGFFLIAYMLGLTPVLFGVLYHKVFCKTKATLAACFSVGMILLFALFWIEAFVAVSMHRWLTTLVKYWLLSSTIVNLAAIVTSAGLLFEVTKNWITFLKRKGSGRIVVLIGMIVIAASILFFVPIQDDVTEYTQSAVMSNEMYLYHPYLNEARIEMQEAKRLFPYEMLYAIPARLAGIPTAFVVKTLVPMVMLCFFFTSMWEIGKQFFKEKPQVFFLFVLFMVSYPLYTSSDYIGGAILLNSWYGPCILNCIILPLAAALGLKIKCILGSWILYIAVVMAAQLMDIRGGYYTILILGLCLLIGIGRKGYNYVKSHGRDESSIFGL